MSETTEPTVQPGPSISDLPAHPRVGADSPAEKPQDGKPEKGAPVAAVAKETKRPKPAKRRRAAKRAAAHSDAKPRASRARVVAHKFRIERADGSRIWHYENHGDAQAATALATERGLGTIVRTVALDHNGEPVE